MSVLPPDSARTTLVLIDVQERLLAAFAEPTRQSLLPRLKLLLTAARELSWPVVITEQYPKGLGSTVAELKAALDPAWPLVTKTSFSCFGEPSFLSALSCKRQCGENFAGMAPPDICDNLIVCGIEAHVCVQQTVMEAMEAGFARVIVPADAVASRHDQDHRLAMSLMAREGAWVSSTEAIVFMFLKNARHPAFKPLSLHLRHLS